MKVHASYITWDQFIKLSENRFIQATSSKEIVGKDVIDDSMEMEFDNFSNYTFEKRDNKKIEVYDGGDFTLTDTYGDEYNFIFMQDVVDPVALLKTL